MRFQTEIVRKDKDSGKRCFVLKLYDRTRTVDEGVSCRSCPKGQGQWKREFCVEIVRKDKDSRKRRFVLKLSERTRTVKKGVSC